MEMNKMVQATSARKKMVFGSISWHLALPKLSLYVTAKVGRCSGRDYFVDAGWYGA